MSDGSLVSLRARAERQIEISNRALELIGESDWTPQDAAHSMLKVTAEDLVAALEAAERMLSTREGWFAESVAAQNRATVLEADLEETNERLLAAQQALRDVLDCKGPYSGTVSEFGGYPALCHECVERAREALAAVGRDPAQDDQP